METLPVKLIHQIPFTNSFIIHHPTESQKGYIEFNDGYYVAWAILIFNSLFSKHGVEIN